jgi:hypothetical protein
VRKHSDYIASQTLALEVTLAPAAAITGPSARETDIEEQVVRVLVAKT